MILLLTIISTIIIKISIPPDIPPAMAPVFELSFPELSPGFSESGAAKTKKFNKLLLEKKLKSLA